MLAAGLAWLAIPADPPSATVSRAGPSSEITMSLVSDLMPGERASVAAPVDERPLTAASPAAPELQTTDPPRARTRETKSTGAAPLNSTICRPVGLGVSADVAARGAPDDPGPAASVHPARAARMSRLGTARGGRIDCIPSGARRARCGVGSDNYWTNAPRRQSSLVTVRPSAA